MVSVEVAQKAGLHPGQPKGEQAEEADGGIGEIKCGSFQGDFWSKIRVVIFDFRTQRVNFSPVGICAPLHES